MVELKSENERLRALLRQSGIDTPDASLASAQRNYRHEQELAGERARTAEAEENVRSASARADLVEAKHADLIAIHTLLLTNTEFSRQILENSTDCIKVLDLDGRLEFMSAGGMRMMEIDDFSHTSRPAHGGGLNWSNIRPSRDDLPLRALPRAGRSMTCYPRANAEWIQLSKSTLRTGLLRKQTAPALKA
jgi:hypothetical protein